MSEARNIYQRINSVREGNAYIKKNKEVDGKYTVVTHDEVTAHIRDDLIKHGVVIEPQLDGEPKEIDTGKTMGKSPVWRITAIYVVWFVNVDQPDDRAKVRVLAQAEDTGDKGAGKLISYAVKMAILKMFNIETGDREEDRIHSDGSKMDENAMADWRAKCDEVKTAPEGAKLWSEMVDACRKINDEPTLLTLRAYLSASMSKKGIKLGQRRNGGADARTTAH